MGELLKKLLGLSVYHKDTLLCRNIFKGRFTGGPQASHEKASVCLVEWSSEGLCLKILAQQTQLYSQESPRCFTIQADSEVDLNTRFQKPLTVLQTLNHVLNYLFNKIILC